MIHVTFGKSSTSLVQQLKKKLVHKHCTTGYWLPRSLFKFFLKFLDQRCWRFSKGYLNNFSTELSSQIFDCCPRNFLIQEERIGNVVSTSHWIRPVMKLFFIRWEFPHILVWYFCSYYMELYHNNAGRGRAYFNLGLYKEKTPFVSAQTTQATNHKDRIEIRSTIHNEVQVTRVFPKLITTQSWQFYQLFLSFYFLA